MTARWKPEWTGAPAPAPGSRTSGSSTWSMRRPAERRAIPPSAAPTATPNGTRGGCWCAGPARRNASAATSPTRRITWRCPIRRAPPATCRWPGRPRSPESGSPVSRRPLRTRLRDFSRPQGTAGRPGQPAAQDALPRVAPLATRRISAPPVTSTRPKFLPFRRWRRIRGRSLFTRSSSHRPLTRHGISRSAMAPRPAGTVPPAGPVTPRRAVSSVTGPMPRRRHGPCSPLHRTEAVELARRAGFPGATPRSGRTDMVQWRPRA